MGKFTYCSPECLARIEGKARKDGSLCGDVGIPLDVVVELLVAQLQRVQNLFHSVGLNVNNPHFLIMQGRITKVLNMKPPVSGRTTKKLSASFVKLLT